MFNEGVTTSRKETPTTMFVARANHVAGIRVTEFDRRYRGSYEAGNKQSRGQSRVLYADIRFKRCRWAWKTDVAGSQPAVPGSQPVVAGRPSDVAEKQTDLLSVVKCHLHSSVPRKSNNCQGAAAE